MIRFNMFGCWVLALFLGMAQGESIPVNNASFEEPKLTRGDWACADSPEPSIPFWDDNPDILCAGFNFYDAEGFASDGVTIGAVEQDTEMYQGLGIGLTPDTVYTLTVNIGRRVPNETKAGNESRFGLYLGGPELASGTLLVDGTFDAHANLNVREVSEDQSVIFATGSSVDPGNLFISLRSTGNARAYFDNIRLDAAPLAETATRTLLAGDADQDLDFDQLDLVQVQVAAKYLTGQAATWGQGDWNGAPGGSPGNPPLGDGLFDQFDVIAAQRGAAYLTGPYAAIQANGTNGDGQTSVVYNAGSGELSVDAPSGVELTSINIDSAAGIFTGASAQNLGGSFDNDADANIFKATFGGSFGSVSFGNVAQSGLSEEFVLGDLSVVGSLAGGGDLGNVDLVYVPEPSTIGMLVVGMILGLRSIRRTTYRGSSTRPSHRHGLPFG